MAKEKQQESKHVINFRKMSILGIDGNPYKENGEVVYQDVAIELGNDLYYHTNNLAVSEFGKEIFRKGEVEITPQLVNPLIMHITNSENISAPFKRTILNKLNEIKTYYEEKYSIERG